MCELQVWQRNYWLVQSEEWTTNRAVVDTTGVGLRNAIPDNFAYFHVAWAGGGYVHPIEDENKWSPYFGLDIIAGMCGDEGYKFGRKERRQNFEEQRQAVLRFIEAWKPFDWTVELDGGEY